MANFIPGRLSFKNFIKKVDFFNLLDILSSFGKNRPPKKIFHLHFAKKLRWRRQSSLVKTIVTDIVTEHLGTCQVPTREKIYEKQKIPG